MPESSPTPNDVRTFSAQSLAEALELVRNALGPDAVILETREIQRPRWQFWKREERWIEVSAGTGIQAPSRFLRGPSSRPSVIPQTTPAPTEGATQPPNPTSIRLHEPSALGAVSRPALPPVVVPPVAAELAAGQVAMSRQLLSIQQMVAQLSQQSAARADELPLDQFEVFTRLIDAEVDESLARELVAKLHQQSPAESSFEVLRPKLQSLLEAGIRCAPPIAVTPGRRRVVALVGPTGVGKTTTIAKLAANLRIRDGVKMGLVTVDTFRIAAVEQLRTYAEIIDLPMKVVTTALEMRRALDELAGLDLILIDTAGRSPRDDLKIQELRLLLEEAQVDEVHLVLSLVASLKSLQTTAAQFTQAGATSLVLTKLDEALGMGALASVARRIPLPISYLTTGQDVPNDIEPASARRVARLVLGDEHVGSRLRNAA